MTGATTDSPQPLRAIDQKWRARAARVIPDGSFGHVRPEYYPPAYPQFYGRAAGARIWDVDGNPYIDLMCSWGPMIVGYRRPEVEDAYRREAEQRELAFGMSPRAVELAERFVSLVEGADWAMFQKNGGDATMLAVTVARQATGRRKLLRATGSYHGSTPWFTPIQAGITPEDRANLIEFAYNDVDSLEAAAREAGSDFAAAILTPHRHDTDSDSVPIEPGFARRLRELCDRQGAALILDDVRAGFRISMAGSWAPLGIAPDLCAFSKCIANGYPLAAVTGCERLRDAAASIYATGSFWYASGPMAASLACLEILEREDGIATMNARGTQLMEGMRQQADSHGVAAVLSGPSAMPNLTFQEGAPREHAFLWSEEAIRRGVLVHPYHNWFLSTAHTAEDIELVLEATDAAFRHVASRS